MPNDQNENVDRVQSTVATGVFFSSQVHKDMPLADKPNVLNIYPVPGDPARLVNEALARDLSQVDRIRFDPVNACNIACVFCGVDQKKGFGIVPPEDFERLLRKIAPTCTRILVGCGHEPLMAKNIDQYGKIIASVISEFKNPPLVSMTSNGLLFGNRKVDTLLSTLTWLHISIASHRADHYEEIQKKADFSVLVENVQRIRKTYPKLRMHTELVLNSINREDALPFIRWAAEEMGFNSINVRRVNTEVEWNETSYFAEHAHNGLKLALTNNEWEKVIRDVIDVYPTIEPKILDEIASGQLTKLELLELTRTEVLQAHGT